MGSDKVRDEEVSEKRELESKKEGNEERSGERSDKRYEKRDQGTDEETDKETDEETRKRKILGEESSLSRLWFPISAVWDLQCTDFTAVFLKFFYTTP